MVQREVYSGDECSVDEYFYFFGLVGRSVGSEAGQKGGRPIGAIFVFDDDGVADSGADCCFFEASAEDLA